MCKFRASGCKGCHDSSFMGFQVFNWKRKGARASGLREEFKVRNFSWASLIHAVSAALKTADSPNSLSHPKLETLGPYCILLRASRPGSLLFSCICCAVQSETFQS